MAADFVAATSGVPTLGSSITISPHADTQVGDYMVVFIQSYTGQTTEHVDWTTHVRETGGSGPTAYVYVAVKIREEGETSYTFTVSSFAQVRYKLMTFRGDGELAKTAISGTAGSGSITVADGLLVAGCTAANDDTPDPNLVVPTGYTAVADQVVHDNNAIRAAYKTVTAGVVTNTWTNTGSGLQKHQWAFTLAESLQPPVTNFSLSASQIFDSQTVTLTDTSTSDPTAWVWERKLSSASVWEQFSTAQNPSAVSFTAGIWDIRLTATNDAGSDDETKTGSLVVLPASLYAASVVTRGLVVLGESSANADVSVTVPPGNTIGDILYSYSAAPTGGLLTIEEVQTGTSYVINRVMRHAVTTTIGQLQVNLPSPAGADQKITLAAGGSGVVGRITVLLRGLE